MKKFLSLVLALVMTFSLMTVAAGATEYKDLTDKNEITYEAAVAVLNKLGIITGYEDGSFGPTKTLTRGAAAKIIVSLMIGADAANSLSISAAPYKDVAANSTFATYISYCKTAGYISGYSDGTFKPTATLTGYAFSKMLLGALGYKASVQGYTGSGWTMNVASDGNKAGLFNDITDFSGNTAVTREVACALALNTLKATEVEYKGSNVSVSTGAANVVVDNTELGKVTNSSTSDGNIYVKNTTSGNGKDGYMQFAEEHFSSLKMSESGNATDDFGRPATTWTYKNAKIGDYATAADFTFTAGIGKSSDDGATALKNMGIKGYDLKGAKVYVNGSYAPVTLSTTDNDAAAVAVEGYTGNGYTVELFCGSTANTIKSVIVLRPQIMQVSSVSSTTVSLKTVGTATGVAAVKDDNGAFKTLSALKADDYVMIQPCKTSSSTPTVSKAYAPTVVTGALSSIYSNTSGNTNAVTVASTKYSVAAYADTDLTGLKADDVKNSKKDVTLYVDALGYAAYIKDTGSSEDYMVYANSYQSLVNGKLVNYVEGYDFSGNTISINLGNNGSVTGSAVYGDIIKYTSTSSSNNNADYTAAKVTSLISDSNTTGSLVVSQTSLSSSATSVDNYTVASDVKTIFVTYNTDGTVKSVSIKSGMANVISSELVNTHGSAMMYVKKNAVKAIVVKSESSDVVSDNVLYIKQLTNTVVASGTTTYTYTAYIDGVETTGVTSTKKLDNGQFASYVKNSDGSYTLSAVTAYASATSAFTFEMRNDQNVNAANNDLIYNLDSTTNVVNDMNSTTTGTTSTALNTSGTTVHVLNTNGAKWIDLTGNGIDSGKALKNCVDLNTKTLKVSIIVNNKSGADNQYKIATIVIDK